jgi:hypothetical protein
MEWYTHTVSGDVMPTSHWDGFNKYMENKKFPGDWVHLDSKESRYSMYRAITPDKGRRKRFWWNTNRDRDTVLAFTHQDECELFKRLLAQFLLTHEV